jgi:saccharopine dehydrogenase-like NADP-dependent oxidoreductase
VIVFAAASGRRCGRFEQETRLARIYGAPLRGVDRTAIELTTAAGVVGVLELLRAGRLPASGFIRQEQVALADFLRTRAGPYYAALADPEVNGNGDAGSPVPCPA